MWTIGNPGDVEGAAGDTSLGQRLTVHAITIRIDVNTPYLNNLSSLLYVFVNFDYY